MDDIKTRIRSIVSPTRLDLSDPMEIVALGSGAVPIVIEYCKNPVTSYGHLDQGLLVCALVEFARSGDAKAHAFLTQVANGHLRLTQAYGDVAFDMARQYCSASGGQSVSSRRNDAEGSTKKWWQFWK